MANITLNSCDVCFRSCNFGVVSEEQNAAVADALAAQAERAPCRSEDQNAAVADAERAPDRHHVTVHAGRTPKAPPPQLVPPTVVVPGGDRAPPPTVGQDADPVAS